MQLANFDQSLNLFHGFACLKRTILARLKMSAKFEHCSVGVVGIYLPFLPDSDVDGGVVHEVKGLGTDLLLGTGLCPTGGLLLALVPTLLAPGPVSSGVVGALLPPTRPPPAVGLVGDESPPPPPWVFSSTPLS